MRNAARGMLLCALGVLGCLDSHGRDALVDNPAPETDTGIEPRRPADTRPRPSDDPARPTPPPEASTPHSMGSAGAAVIPVSPLPMEPSAGGADAPEPPDPSEPVDAWPAPSGPIAERLFGHWQGQGAIGNCINFEAWYSFGDDGRLVNRLIDDNDCSGRRLVAEASGYYALEGRLLGIVLDGPGSAPSFEMTSTTAEIGERQERFTVAFADRPADPNRPAATLFDGEAFTSEDGATYRSERYLLLIAKASGDPLYEQEILVSAHFDPALPLAEGAATHVTLTFVLSQFDAAVSPDAVVDALTIEFDAVVRADNGWKQVIAAELNAAAPEARATAWDAMLSAARLNEDHTQSFAWTYRQHVFAAWHFTDDDPNVLSVGLPGYGQWTKSDVPP